MSFEMQIIDIQLVQKNKPKYHKYVTINKQLIRKNKKEKIYHNEIENFLHYLEVKIEHYCKIEAQFLISEDKIQLPFKSSFKNLNGVNREQNYYSTLFHELGHWTGHTKRMKRASLTRYGRVFKEHDGYDFDLRTLEEVSAELFSNMMMDFFKLQKKPSKQSLCFLNKELSYFDKEYQEKLYKKATSQATAAFNFIKKRYNLHVKENRAIRKD